MFTWVALLVFTIPLYIFIRQMMKSNKIRDNRLIETQKILREKN